MPNALYTDRISDFYEQFRIVEISLDSVDPLRF